MTRSKRRHETQRVIAKRVDIAKAKLDEVEPQKGRFANQQYHLRCPSGRDCNVCGDNRNHKHLKLAEHIESEMRKDEE